MLADFCDDNITVSHPDCGSLDNSFCGEYNKSFTDLETMRPHYQKSDGSKYFIHASLNSWFISDGSNNYNAIALKESGCPYYSDIVWNYFKDKKVCFHL